MKKACKKCRILFNGNECPLCKDKNFSENWKGKIIILNASKSMIAEKLKIKSKGEYAIKVK